MKPEGNKEGDCVGRTDRPQRPIGYKDNAIAKFESSELLESEGSERFCKER